MIAVCFDGDQAGRVAAERWVKKYLTSDARSYDIASLDNLPTSVLVEILSGNWSFVASALAAEDNDANVAWICAYCLAQNENILHILRRRRRARFASTAGHQLDKDEVKSAADIVTVVSHYIHLERRGAMWWGLCPFHDDTQPSLSVSPQRRTWKCWSCGAQGDVFDFVMKYQKVGFPEAVGIVADITRHFG